MLKPISQWDQAFKCTVNERLNTGTNTGPLEKVDEFNWLILEVFLGWNPSLDHVPSHIKNQMWKLLKKK